MKVNPRTDKEFQDMKLMEPGEYAFTVSEAVETYSQAGNEMIKLTLKVINNLGRVYTINDFLLDSDAMGFKIRHLCDAVGLIDKYESGEINAKDILNKRGMAKISIQKDKKGIYSDKNIVSDYIVDKDSKNENFLNDDLTF